MGRAPKILALQFKYFGDAVLLIPALRALREHWPDAELHALLPEQIAPLFHRLPWLDRVWPMPRQRGRARPGLSWPVIRALRRERFDRSVDFAGNDRGALLSLLCGAPIRLGLLTPGGFFGRRFCYTQRVSPGPRDRHETLRLLSVLSPWGITATRSLETEIHPDPALADAAQKLLPEPGIICHLASSQPKKEWPLTHWAALHRLAAASGIPLIFGTGVGAREEARLTEFRQLAPTASLLPTIPDLALYLAVLRRARAFVSGDTGPLHFAAGLGVPTLALFGPSSSTRWAPVGARHAFLSGSSCGCGDGAVCESASPCIAAIPPEQVLARLAVIAGLGS